MKRNYKHLALALTVGILAGRYLLQPKPKVEIKEVVKYVTKEVEKKSQDKDKEVVVIERKLKDGTIEKRTEVKEVTKTVTNTKIDSKLESTSKTSVKGSGITLGVLAITDLNFSGKHEYGATVTVPLMGPIKVQALGTTDKKIGVGVAIEF